ncbi:hypothetical protein MPDQ_002783 [Monascus purpureus]|uniref:FAS1 domain-containing protein n=1 Tax=Monascus purpureus TaxID=5098 RepID=A0A507R310_MONPU|nr:hypothetical protein MPDQ_002783 [Monascus purpureus]BDD60180.1 hypothetical protein MAP00_005329 [Monascus purpureus]
MASHTTLGHLVFVLAIIFASLTCTAYAIWVPSVPDSGHLSFLHGKPQQGKSQDRGVANQHPIMEETAPNTIVISPFDPDDDIESSDGRPVVSDVLPKNRAINIFASLTRDFEPIASRLNDESRNVTVLAPRNSAIQALRRKPWESTEEYRQFGPEAYEGQDGQDRAKNNLRRFVEAHLIPVSPWKNGEEVESLGGGKLKWTKEANKIFIQPGNIEVDTVAEKVSNGEVWILNGVINYT